MVARALGAKRPRSVMFSGAGPGAGNTTAVIETARNLALMYGAKVVLVEFDSRAPTLAERLGLEPARGLPGANGARPLDERLQTTAEGLTVLAGAADVRSGEAGFVAQFGRVLRELESRFDFVLLDMPPIPEQALVLAVGALVPQIVIVVEAQGTRFATLQRIRSDLAREGITVLGGILNKRRRFVPDWIARRLKL